jgi:hypothetical protein
VTLATLSVAAAMAAMGISAASGSRSASLRIPLPPPNTAQVSELTVKVTAPAGKHVGKLNIVATNAAWLGSSKGNTQVVTATSLGSAPTKQSTTFKVWVFIHRFAPFRRSASAGADATADLELVDAGDEVKVTVWVHSQSCRELQNERGWKSTSTGPGETAYFDFYTDDFEEGVGHRVYLDNLVLAFDTDSEAQIDNAVHDKCPAAEDPANDPPPN